MKKETKKLLSELQEEEDPKFPITQEEIAMLKTAAPDWVNPNWTKNQRRAFRKSILACHTADDLAHVIASAGLCKKRPAGRFFLEQRLKEIYRASKQAPA